MSKSTITQDDVLHYLNQGFSVKEVAAILNTSDWVIAEKMPKTLRSKNGARKTGTLSLSHNTR